jgi:hypothetical protein
MRHRIVSVMPSIPRSCLAPKVKIRQRHFAVRRDAINALVESITDGMSGTAPMFGHRGRLYLQLWLTGT